MPSIALSLSLRGQLLSGSRFNPISLFSAGEQGFWLEPSDLTTMFQDRAGTTPVTTPGQTVGLRLDKSKGLVLGSELIANGDFSGGSTGWTITASGTNTITISSGSVRFVTNGSADAATLSQPWSGATAVGKYYRITFDVLSGSTGQLKITTLGVSTVIGEHTFTATPGAKSFTLVSANVTNIGISRVVGQSADATIDNISVKEIPGNHAVAPTDAARPTYGIEPKTGRRNLLTYTEQFENAVWTTSGSTISVNAAVAPDGMTTADKLVEDTANSQHAVVVASGSRPTIAVGNHTHTVYVKADGRTAATLYNNGTSGGAGASFSLTSVTVTQTGGTQYVSSAITAVGNDWYRLSLTFLSVGGTAALTVYIGSAFSGEIYTGNGTSGILIWGAQLELGSTATAYQRVGTAFDVTEAGVSTVHYVQYDGTDDSFSTSSIDFTATDKMSVFAGVRKLSDALRGMAVEIGSGGANGSFAMEAPDNNGAITFAFRSIGTSAAVTSFAANAAPITRIVTGLGNIAAPSSIIRLDGVQVNQNTNTQGTGNYGNYPLFIGRRNNATIPFNGRDYGIIIVGKTASASEIAATESYLAANTSGVSI
jgi:hypothetical protein